MSQRPLVTGGKRDGWEVHTMLKATHKALMLAVLVGVSVLAAGCDGGNGPPLAAAGLQVTSIQVDPSLQAQGIVCLNITVSGPANGTFDFLPEYMVSTDTTRIPATEVSQALQQQQGITSSGTMGLPLSGSGVLTFSFYWAAGVDLGFLSASVQFCATPFDNGDPANPNGVELCSGFFPVEVGNPSQSSAGPGVGSGPGGGTGRAFATSHHVRATTNPNTTDDDVVVVGGKNGSPAPNAFNTTDRFTFDPSSFTHNLQSLTNPGGTRRVLHASAWFANPSSHLINVLVTGGVDRGTPPPLSPGAPSLISKVAGATDVSDVDIYRIDSGGYNLIPGPALAGPRYAHTATWVPGNFVVVIGGASGTSVFSLTGLSSIEMFTPDTSSPGGTWTTKSAFLGGGAATPTPRPRALHSATLMPDGRIFIVGGFNPQSPATALPIEIYDPVADTISEMTAPVGIELGRTNHTATRLMDGRILVVGGRDLSGNLLDDAFIYNPATLGFTSLTLDQARAQHTATLLGNGQVLIAGGVTPVSSPAMAGALSSEEFTSSVLLFRPGTSDFSPVNPLSTVRADQTASASGSGSVYIIGGRNGVPSGTNFLDDVEFFAFSNAVPQVSSPATSTAGTSNMMNINMVVTDVDNDGGFAFIRFKELGSTDWKRATINSQITPTNQTLIPPTFQITPGNNTFVWNFTADGVAGGTVVQIEILPVGAVVGSPVLFMAQTTGP